MKSFQFIALALVAQVVSAHCMFSNQNCVTCISDYTYLNIWNTLIANRQPLQRPFACHLATLVTSVTSLGITCNVNPTPATETVEAVAVATIGFKLDNTLYHPDPAAVYLGKASSPAASWDGSGANWFKIAEWGATFDPFSSTGENASQLTTTIPPNTPAGEVNS